MYTVPLFRIWVLFMFLTAFALSIITERNKAYNRMRKSRLYWLHQDNLLFCPCRQVSSRDGLLLSFGLHLMIPMDLSLLRLARTVLSACSVFTHHFGSEIRKRCHWHVFVTLFKSEIFLLFLDFFELWCRKVG